MTREQKIKFISKKGNIVTFKKSFRFMGQETKQVMVGKFDKKNNRIIGLYSDTPCFKTLDELLDAINFNYGWE